MLSARQQRDLEEIEKRLRRSDSRLASRFSVFAELVSGEEMPKREELPLTLRHRMARLCRSAGRAPQDTGAGFPPRALLLLPLLLVAIICTVLLVGAPPHHGAACRTPPGPGSVIAGQPAPGQLTGWAPAAFRRGPRCTTDRAGPGPVKAPEGTSGTGLR